MNFEYFLPRSDALAHALDVEHAAGKALADKALGHELVVLLEIRNLGGVEELHRVLEPLRRVLYDREERLLVCLGENDKEQTMWCLLPWLGTYAFLALERLIKIKCAAELGIKGVNSSRPYFMTFVMKAGEQEFFSVVKDAAERLEDPMELLYPAEIPYFEKYDELVPTELVRKGFAEGVLDVAGMRERVAQW